LPDEEPDAYRQSIYLRVFAPGHPLKKTVGDSGKFALYQWQEAGGPVTGLLNRYRCVHSYDLVPAGMETSTENQLKHLAMGFDPDSLYREDIEKIVRSFRLYPQQ